MALGWFFCREQAMKGVIMERKRFEWVFMKYMVILFLIILYMSHQETQAADIADSVVKVFTTTNRTDFYRPWQTKGVEGINGSGCIIEGKRILTNAHVVSDQTFIQVKKYGDPKKYVAELVAIAHDCDLALLKVKDERFFENVEALEIGDLPILQDTVNVIGFPMGGDEISITEGVVSRIEVSAYVHSNNNLLAVQIDAALNPGNSGGPVIRDGKLIGVAMQIIPGAENIGYIIPVPIVNHFLRDLEDGNYEGFPKLGVLCKNTENKALREKYKIEANQGGVIVTNVLPYYPAYGKLHEEDIILTINGTLIDEDQSFEFRDRERLSFTHLISQMQLGEVVELTVMRDGMKKNISIPLTQFKQLVPSTYMSSMPPPYYIYGGLVLTVLTEDLFNEWTKYSYPPCNFLDYVLGERQHNEQVRRDVVILTSVLADDVNTGYHDYSNLVIKKVNGREVKSFKELVLTLNKKEGEYTVFEADDKSKIVLKNKDIDEANLRMIKRNRIPKLYSDNVESWLKQD